MRAFVILPSILLLSIVNADVSHLTSQQQYYQQYYQNQQRAAITATAPAATRYPTDPVSSSYNGVANSYVPPASGAVGSYARAPGAYSQERSQTYLIPPIQQQYAKTNIHSQSIGSTSSQYTAGQASQAQQSLSLNTYSSAQANQQYYAQQQAKQLEPIVTKHFYVHAAPEDPEDSAEPQYVYVGRPRKNVKVIFIKAPTYGRVPIVPIYPKNEDKTIVYVLSKKPGAQQIDIPEPPPTEPTKPEVFFIKYKNAAEAQAAQEKIQAAYENGQLGSSDIAGSFIQAIGNINSQISNAATTNVGSAISGASNTASTGINQISTAFNNNVNNVG